METLLQSTTKEKKAVFEMTREADERLRKIRQKEERARERLLQIRTERVEKEQRQRHAARVSTEQGSHLQAELEILKTDNNRLKQQVSALTKSADEKTALASESARKSEELELSRRNNSEQSRQLKKLKESLQRTTRYSKTQEKEKEEKENEIRKLIRRMEDEIQPREAELNVLKTQNEHHNKSLMDLKENLLQIASLSKAQQMTVKWLEDKISAAQQIAIETQLRRLDELGSLTEESKELKQGLNALHRQQKQQPTAEDHRGTRFSTSSNW